MSSLPKQRQGGAPNGTGATNGALKSFLKAFPVFQPETVAEVSERGLLSLSRNGEWRLGDGNNGSTRRLDQPTFKRSDNKGARWHQLIGLSDVIEHDRRNIVFVLEGCKDALAAFNGRNFRYRISDVERALAKS